jgi:hypothetical protein
MWAAQRVVNLPLWEIQPAQGQILLDLWVGLVHNLLPMGRSEPPQGWYISHVGSPESCELTLVGDSTCPRADLNRPVGGFGT